jgi:hypothetical protein
MSTPPPPPSPQDGPPPEYTWAVPARLGPGGSGSGYGPRYGAPVAGTNGQAVAAFVLGLLAIVPVSVVLGIVALVRIGRTRQRGKGLAIAGLVLSGLWAVAALGGLALAVGYAATHAKAVPIAAGPGAQSGTQPLDALQPGTCFDQTSDTDVITVTVVPCSQPHDRQLFARDVVNPGDPYPGASQATQQALMFCDQQKAADYLDAAGIRSSALTFVYWPTQLSYEHDDAVFYCTLADPGGGRLGSSLWPQSPTYTAAQTDYLRMTKQTTLLRQEIVDGVPSLWAQQRATATQLAQADLAEANALDAGTLQGSFENTTARALATDDREDAVAATDLARSSSQAQWTATEARLDSSSLRGDANALRYALGLPPI